MRFAGLTTLLQCLVPCTSRVSLVLLLKYLFGTIVPEYPVVHLVPESALDIQEPACLESFLAWTD